MRDMTKFVLVAALGLLMACGALASQGTATVPKAQAVQVHQKHHKKHHAKHHRKAQRHAAKSTSQGAVKAEKPGNPPEKAPVRHKAHRGVSQLRTMSSQRVGAAEPTKASSSAIRSMAKNPTLTRSAGSRTKASGKTTQPGKVQRK